MTNEEIKQAVEEYFNEMFAKDADYLDHVTDSWIYDAENWFMCKYSLDWDDKENFRYYTLKRKNELYDEKYGARDAKLLLIDLIYQAEELQDAFESLKHNLKVFPIFNNVVSTDIKNLLEHLQTLLDIENGKIESLEK